MVGSVFRVSEEEQRFMLYDTNARFGGGSYALTPINILRQHSTIVDNLLFLLLIVRHPSLAFCAWRAWVHLRQHSAPESQTFRHAENLLHRR